MLERTRALFFRRYKIKETLIKNKLEEYSSILQLEKFESILHIYSNGDFNTKFIITTAIQEHKDILKFEKYCETQSNNYVTNFMLGVINHQYSARSRGNDVAKNVSENQAELMYEFAEKSLDFLMTALDLNKDDKMVYQVILRVFLYLGYDMETIEKYYDEASNTNGSNFYLNIIMLNIKTPKWLGSEKQLLEFSRRACDGLSAGDPNLALIPAAHYEIKLYLEMQDRDEESSQYLFKSEVKSEILTTFSHMIKEAKYNYSSIKALSTFLYPLYCYKEYQKIAEVLNITNDIVDFDSKPWWYYSFFKKYFYNAIMNYSKK
ncbi:MAG: hypothetical protein HRU38_21040 [Saccharospirillaceae bacterium]|nr:hypothetical protein [Pseudomonadales bacterium]NRB81118.1 hypothetical protein [Saccharospirillaceae bacterium]